jgi:hypothetical protein
VTEPMEPKSKPVWRRPITVLAFAMCVFLGLVGLAARDCRQAAERERAAEVPPPVGGPGSERALAFRHASLVPGTDVMRVDLVRPGSGYSDVRNILFLDPASKSGRWLLPDSEHVIAESLDLEKEELPSVKRVVATAALVKPLGGDPSTTEGRLLLFDPSGRTIEPLANGVRTLHVAALGQGAGFLVMYERDRKFVVATVDASSLKLRTEQVFEIPSLK